MKVLMTGFTALQINTLNRSIQKIDVPAAIADALRSRGHTVDWRKVECGEDLSSYDVIWINLAPLHSLNGRQGAMGSLYALSSGRPCVGFFDDWQFNAVFNGARGLKRHGTKMLYKHLLVGSERGDEAATYFSRKDAEDVVARIAETDPAAASKIRIERYYMTDTDEIVKPFEDRLVQASGDLLDARWAAGMVPVCPMYSWGDRSLVRKRMPASMGPIEALDPSSTINYILDPVTALSPDEKERSWVLGALMPHDTWLEKKTINWPIEIVGSRKLIRKMGGQRFDTEHDVLAFYNKYWGILSPPYPHAGSGWWRSRFLYAAKVGSILVADKGEGKPLGDMYNYTISDIEKMSDEQLVQVAAEQAEAVFSRVTPYEQFVNHCDRIVHRAVAEDKGLARG